MTEKADRVPKDAYLAGQVMVNAALGGSGIGDLAACLLAERAMVRALLERTPWMLGTCLWCYRKAEEGHALHCYWSTLVERSRLW